MITPSSLVVRTARTSDLDALVALEQATFTSDRLSRRQYRAHLASASAVVLVGRLDGQLVGAAVVFFRRGSRLARLYSLATAATARGHGVGGALLHAAEAQACQRQCVAMRLEVRIDNPAAIGLYEHAGYVRFGAHYAYYADGTDAWRYAKDLPAQGG